MGKMTVWTVRSFHVFIKICLKPCILPSEIVDFTEPTSIVGDKGQRGEEVCHPGGAGHVDLPETVAMFSEDFQEIIIGSSSDLDICQVRRYPQDVHNCMKVLFCHQAVNYFQRMS